VQSNNLPSTLIESETLWGSNEAYGMQMGKESLYCRRSHSGGFAYCRPNSDDGISNIAAKQLFFF
jgi:hypothetical protein